MGILRNGAATKYMIYHNGDKLKKGYHNGTKEIWSAGSTVTYHVDTGVQYTEEKDYGADCLAPSLFTPAKDGWTFTGWRKDQTASGDIETALTMESDPVVLYAVFEQDVSVKFVSYGGTEQTVSNPKYYNNETVANASITAPAGGAMDAWTWRGWTDESTADAAVDMIVGNAYGMSANATYYGLYQKTVTLTYAGNGATSGSVAADTGTAYYNAAGNTLNPTFTIKANGFARSGCTWRGWSLGTVGATVTLTQDTTCNALWRYNDMSLPANLGGIYHEAGFTYTIDGTKYKTLYMVCRIGVWNSETNEAKLYVRNSAGHAIWQYDCPKGTELDAQPWTVSLPMETCTLSNYLWYDEDLDSGGCRAGVVSGTLYGRDI